MGLRLAETFASIQGEASHAGRPMFFVRFAGCSVLGCWLHPTNTGKCDTDLSTRHRRSVADVVRGASDSGLEWVCITGGEPTDQMELLCELAAALRAAGHRVMIQTSGVKSIPIDVDWIVVSPKGDCAGPFRIQQDWGHDLKLIYRPTMDVGQLRGWSSLTRFHHYWMQPEWSSPAELDELTTLLLKANHAGAGSWRLSIQTHKFLGIK